MSEKLDLTPLLSLTEKDGVDAMTKNIIDKLYLVRHIKGAWRQEELNTVAELRERMQESLRSWFHNRMGRSFQFHVNLMSRCASIQILSPDKEMTDFLYIQIDGTKTAPLEKVVDINGTGVLFTPRAFTSGWSAPTRERFDLMLEAARMVESWLDAKGADTLNFNLAEAVLAYEDWLVKSIQKINAVKNKENTLEGAKAALDGFGWDIRKVIADTPVEKLKAVGPVQMKRMFGESVVPFVYRILEALNDD